MTTSGLRWIGQFRDTAAPPSPGINAVGPHGGSPFESNLARASKRTVLCMADLLEYDEAESGWGGTMETVTGEFENLLRVDSNLTVQGSLSNGAEILAGTHLVVHGTFGGPLDVAKEGFCTVMGMFNGTVSSNEGLILLYGLISTPLDASFGKVAVGIDSLITGKDGRLYTLLTDGSLEAVVGDVQAGSHNITDDKICAYDPEQDRFVPLPLDS